MNDLRLTISGWLFFVGGVLALGGVLVLGYGSDSKSWSEITEGLIWYLSWASRSRLIIPALLGCFFILALMIGVVAYRGKRAFLRSRAAKSRAYSAETENVITRDQEPKPDAVTEEKILRRARRFLEREWGRAKTADAERILDTMLSLLVDFQLKELSIQAGDDRASCSLRFNGHSKQVTTMGLPLFEKVIGLAKEMIGVEGEGGGEGSVEFRSSSRIDFFSVDLQSQPEGRCLRVKLKEENERSFSTDRGSSDAQDLADGHGQAQSKRARRPSMMMRIERSMSPHSGEWSTPFTGEHDIIDSTAGVVMGFDPSSEREIAPLQGAAEGRRIGSFEGWLRLAAAAVFALAVGFSFWDAYGWGVQRFASGTISAPWLDVEIRIKAEPRSGQVSLNGATMGHTPLRHTLPCRGRKIELMVRSEGFKVWQWSGFCPEAGPLALTAQLQPF
jgi:hypothetical protein